MNCRFSVLSLQRAVLFVMFGHFVTVFAQDDLFITVSSPSGKVAGGISSGGSLPAAAQPMTNQVSLPAIQATVPTVQPVEVVVPEKEPVGDRVQELLRDPFWPVGFYPEGWQKRTSAQSEPDLDSSGWKAAAGRIKISGASKLGGRTVAIVSGELKSPGDPVEVLFEGKTYQWQIVGIEADGRVQLKKIGIK